MPRRDRYKRHDIYIKRIGFSLIRVYRFQRLTQNTSTGEVLLSQLKWPIETIYSGMRPSFNVSNPVWEGSNGITPASGNPNAWRDWHRMTRQNPHECEVLANAVSLLPTTNADPTLIQPATSVTQSSQAQAERLVYHQSQKTITTVSILAHGISIYNNFAAEFFADYQPYHYGGYNIVTPEDDGALMINFNLYPGTYQPSGFYSNCRQKSCENIWLVIIIMATSLKCRKIQKAIDTASHLKGYRGTPGKLGKTAVKRRGMVKIRIDV